MTRWVAAPVIDRAPGRVMDNLISLSAARHMPSKGLGGVIYNRHQYIDQYLVISGTMEFDYSEFANPRGGVGGNMENPSGNEVHQINGLGGGTAEVGV